MKTVTIIPAGGSGRRMGGATPKQYLLLGGIPLLIRTLLAFQQSPVVDDILLALPEADIPMVRRRVVERFGLSSGVILLAGGRERQDSIRNALAHVRRDHDIVLVHDGVRPLVSPELIDRAVTAAWRDGAAAVGLPVRDTVKRVTPEGWVEATLSREGVWLTQTPQAFRREILLSAYAQAAADGFYATDDAALVERMGTPVRMIPGDDENIKVTTPPDLALAEEILRRRKDRGMIEAKMVADPLRLEGVAEER